MFIAWVKDKTPNTQELKTSRRVPSFGKQYPIGKKERAEGAQIAKRYPCIFGVLKEIAAEKFWAQLDERPDCDCSDRSG